MNIEQFVNQHKVIALISLYIILLPLLFYLWMQLLKIVFSIAKEESRPSDQGELAVDKVHTVQRQRRSGEVGILRDREKEEDLFMPKAGNQR